MIPITKPFLPPLSDFQSLVGKIWESNWLTNMGPLASRLERELSAHLKVTGLSLLSSGTTALQIAIKALDLHDEIITTPFSFVATASSIAWEGCTPVFADIDPETLNASPSSIAAAVTSRTSAILVTHIFSNPCDVQAIEQIASAHKLKVIYDAAHAFGVTVDGRSIYEYGDVSVGSLHATKIYHSVEGGIFVAKDGELMRKVNYMRNFGFDGPERFAELGINGKNSEFHAAMGLVNLPFADRILLRHQQLADWYSEKLQGLPARRPVWTAKPNHTYFPLIFDRESDLIRVVERLNAQDVYPRRYFYPSLPQVLPYVRKQAMPIADSVARRVLCLPMYYDLSEENVTMICHTVMAAL